MRVVDEREARTLAATILCPQPKDADLIFVGLVQLRELFSEFVFGAIRAAWVENVSAERSDVSEGFISLRLTRSKEL